MKRLNIDPTALLIFAAVVYFRSMKDLLAMLLAALAHELGHIAALSVMGERITAFSFEKSGFAMEYAEELSAFALIIAALMGPVTGVVYTALASALSNDAHDFWRVSADMSLLLSVYNLLPVSPLDGGRACTAACCLALGSKRGEKTAGVIAASVKTLMLIAGIYLALKYRHYALLLAEIWLIVFTPRGRTIHL